MKKISALAIAGVMTASLAATAFAESDVKVGGEIRVRHVELNNYDYNSNSGDAGNTTAQRTRINIDAKANETTKAFIQLQDTRLWGSESSTTTTSGNVDVSQAYLQLDQLAGQPLSLRLGRQALAYGDHRLVGNFEWSNFARRFDAAKLMYNTDAFSVDLWLSNIDENRSLSSTGTEVGGTAAAAGTEEDGQFNGLYATLKMIPMNTLDIYALQKKNTATAQDDNVMTYGLRLNGGAMNIDWTAEYAMQSGDASATTKKKASMYAVKAGYTLPEVASLRIGAEYDFASGQDSSTDNTAFDQLYPTNHPLYGVTDVAITNTFSNLKAWSVNVGAKPAEGLKLLAEYWNYSKDQGAATGIGTEFNLQAWYALNKNVDLHGYYAQFTPHSDLSATTDAATNLTLQVAVKF